MPRYKPTSGGKEIESKYKFADMTAMPTRTAGTASFLVVYSRERGSISWSTRNAMIPPTAMNMTQ